MHARHASARLAPKKANLIAKMVRGMAVPDAVELLRRTSKKGARLIEDVLRSAMANAQHNFKQDPQMMIVKMIVVNQGTHYKRGTPMARGRVRPLRKFLSHIDVTLGFPEIEKESKDAKEAKESKEKKSVRAGGEPLQAKAKTVKTSTTSPSQKIK